MSIRLVAADVDPERGVMLRSDFTYLRRYIGLHRFLSFPAPLHQSPCTILSDWRSIVRYDLEAHSLTIRSYGLSLYDINLRATATAILSIRGVQIPIYLVTSATDSLGEA